ncbi:MAG: glycosyltransferase [Bacteroidia bacterium]|nr:glycosyltransferase [Bacteroidia bacterium]
MILSVVSIAYNNLEGLKKTLDIFKSGSFAHSIELIVVDGGSSDGTRSFLEQQNFINKWVSEPDKGIYNAMNKGLKMAEGDYVWFLNSGDYAYNSQSVKALLEALESGPDAIYAETMMVDVNGNELGIRSELSTRKLPSQLTWKSFSLGMNVGHQSFVIKRNLALPYDEQYRFVSDIDWMIKCLKQCKQVLNLQSILSCFTLDGFSTKNRNKSNNERFRVLSRHYGFWTNLFNHIYIVWRKLFNKNRI